LAAASFIAKSVRLALSGIFLGIVCAIALTRDIATLLYDIGAQDPLSYYIISLVVGLAVVFAAWLPAKRAASIAPVVALRKE